RFRGAADEKGPAMPKPSQGVTVVALLADPDTPTENAERMARRLPDRLSRKSDKGRRFDVRVVSEPVTAGSEDPPTVMRRIRERANAEDWDVVVALTDLPLHSHGRKLVVDLNHEYALRCFPCPRWGPAAADEGPEGSGGGRPQPDGSAGRSAAPLRRSSRAGPSGPGR